MICVNEQTSVPHIYAIGDAIEGAPELTPSAIQAGVLLARRLFHGFLPAAGGGGGGAAGSSQQPTHTPQYMNYRDIATTVFTPLELGTVGMTEEEAARSLGEENVESYVSVFQPLEWSLMHKEEMLQCIAKIVVDKRPGKVSVRGLACV